MTRIHCILLCLLAVPMWGQQQRKVDWNKCQQITAAWEDTISKFNADPERQKDGLRVEAACLFSTSNTGAVGKPDRHLPLKADEIAILHSLRKQADAAFAAQAAYEKLLLAKRRLEPWETTTKPCTLTAMIRLMDDYITVEGSPVDANFYDCAGKAKSELPHPGAAERSTK